MNRQKKQRLFFLAEGNSLYPFFSTGDLFEVVADEMLVFGDLAAYTIGEKVFVHRFLFAFRGKAFLTSSYGKVETISQDAVIGKVIRVKKRATTIFRRVKWGGFQVPVHFLYAQWVRLRSRF